LNRRKKQRNQNADNRNHDKKFNKREPCSDNNSTAVLEKETSETGNPGNILPNNRTSEKAGNRGNTPGNKACKNRNKKVGNRNSKPNNKGGKSRIAVVRCFCIIGVFYPPPPQELVCFLKTPKFGLEKELVVVKLGFFI
jgi:hypothetical protein